MNSTEDLPQMAILSPQQAWDTTVPLGHLLYTVIWDYRSDAELHAVIVPGIKPCLRRSMNQPASTSQKQLASINQPAPINKPQPTSINTLPLQVAVAAFRSPFALSLRLPRLEIRVGHHWWQQGRFACKRIQSWWPEGLTTSLKSWNAKAAACASSGSTMESRSVPPWLRSLNCYCCRQPSEPKGTAPKG